MVKIVRSDSPRDEPSPKETSQLAQYLAQAMPVTVAAGRQVDTRDPSRGLVVPVGLVTDGSVVWPMELEYYFDSYGGSVYREVLASARENRFEMPPVDDVAMRSLRAVIAEASRIALVDPIDSGDAGLNPFG